MSSTPTPDSPAPPPHKLIEILCKATETTYRADKEVKQAFAMGLFFGQLPVYMLEHLNMAHDWDLYDIDPSLKGNWGVFELRYPLTFKFNFIADTGTSWHPIYQELRQRGWKRLKVHRQGGSLQYLMQMIRDGMPEGYSTLHLLLNIAISTCKQVQVGTEMKEVPVMKTVCEDLVELEEENKEDAVATSSSAEVIPLVVIDDIEELQQRRDSKFEDEIPF